jgi:hypothetical protein
MCSLLEEQDDSLFTYPYTIRNQDTPLTALIDTCAIGGNFIYFQTARVLCNINGITLYTLQDLIKVQGFNSQLAPKITHKLTVYLKIGRHS